MKKRVLQLTNTITKQNGRSQVVMNVSKRIENLYVFDYLVCESPNEEDFYDEISNQGGIIYQSKTNLLSMLQMTIKALQANKYAAIEYHATSKWLLLLPLIAMLGKTKIIFHAHNMALGKNKRTNLRNRLLMMIFRVPRAERVAVSKIAGKGTFKNKKFEIVANGINDEEYAFNANTRKKIRDDFGIKNDDVVIGNVARHSEEKNQIFLLKMMEILSANNSYHLFLIGDGPETIELKRRAKEMGLNSTVHFLGMRSDVKDLYSALDVFVLPSFVEGLPTVILEAMANGIECVVSNTTAKELNIEGTHYLPIDESAINLWAKKIEMLATDIVRPRNDIVESLRSSRFEVKNAAKEWKVMYEK